MIEDALIEAANVVRNRLVCEELLRNSKTPSPRMKLMHATIRQHSTIKSQMPSQAGTLVILIPSLWLRLQLNTSFPIALSLSSKSHRKTALIAVNILATTAN